jgi:hypothetical protein
MMIEWVSSSLLLRVGGRCDANKYDIPFGITGISPNYVDDYVERMIHAGYAYQLYQVQPRITVV